MNKAKKFLKIYGGTFLGLCAVLYVSGVVALLLIRAVSQMIGFDLVTGHTITDPLKFYDLFEFAITGSVFGLVFNAPALIITYPFSIFMALNNVRKEIFIPALVVWFTSIGLFYEAALGREMAGLIKLFFCAGIPASVLIWISFRKIIAWAEKP